MVVVGLAGVAIVAVPILAADAIHVPAPMAAMVAEPPGSRAQETVWSGPASGLAMTVTVVLSGHPAGFVHTK